MASHNSACTLLATASASSPIWPRTASSSVARWCSAARQATPAAPAPSRKASVSPRVSAGVGEGPPAAEGDGAKAR
jgi:hypothetical protein